MQDVDASISASSANLLEIQLQMVATSSTSFLQLTVVESKSTVRQLSSSNSSASSKIKSFTAPDIQLPAPATRISTTPQVAPSSSPIEADVVNLTTTTLQLQH
jgi:hypothetical protein